MAIQGVPTGNDIARATGGGPGVPVRYEVTNQWVDYFLEQAKLLDASSRKLVTVALTAVGGSLPTTPLILGSNVGNLFRVNYVVQVETPASTSSSLQVAVSYIANGYAVQEVGPAMTSNSQTVPMSGVFFIKSDTPNISMSTIWSSVGGTSMTYRLTATVEAVAP